MENCLPYTDEVMVGFVYKCVQQTRHLTLQLAILRNIFRLLNTLNGLVYFIRKGDPRGYTLMKMP